MIRSYLIAGGVAIAAVTWVASGQFTAEEAIPVDEVASAVGTTESAENETMMQVRVQRSVAKEHQSSMVLFGRTEGVRSVEVKVQTAGRIVSVKGKKGSFVKKGEVLARIEMADRQARLKEAEAQVERYEIAYAAAKKLSQKQFRSKVQLAEAVANLETAKAGLRSMRVDIARTTIRAPFDGILDDIPVNVGDYVAVGNVSAKVVDLDPILIVGDVTERVAAGLKIGDSAVVTPVGQATQEATVSYISKVGSTTTRTFRVEISLDNPEGLIAEGVTSELRLKLGSIQAHFLTPAVLTLNDAGEVGVKIVDSEGVVQFYSIQIIDDTPEGIWLTGLPETADLIVVGQEFVRTGQKVQTTEVNKDAAS